MNECYTTEMKKSAKTSQLTLIPLEEVAAREKVTLGHMYNLLNGMSYCPIKRWRQYTFIKLQPGPGGAEWFAEVGEIIPAPESVKRPRSASVNGRFEKEIELTLSE